jgi:dCTP deaminase
MDAESDRGSAGTEIAPAGDTHLPAGILSKAIIHERLARSPPEVDALVITPLDRGAIDIDSIDLRLGSRFLVPYPYKLQEAVQYGRELDASRFQRLVHVGPGGQIVVPPHSTVLGSVYEYIKLPYNISGQILTKSSLARLFITIEGAPWVHPLYRGCLTLEIANASGTPVLLRPLTPIAQLVLFAVTGVERPAKDKIEGTYIGPTEPELTGF